MDGQRDTICALTTGAPPSAIAMVRISGPAVQTIGQRLLEKGLPEPRRAALRTLRSVTGDVIDRVLTVFMPGPNSYTGEDTLELSLHGGAIIVEWALETLFEVGARLAEPGEFTKRAFEAGKLDLTRAEAVADLIEAETRVQHEQAMKQMDGALAQLYEGWQGQVRRILALLEASIDFPDEDDAPDNVDTPVQSALKTLISNLAEAIKDGNITERIRDGFKIAILGEPNAGKSTLLNYFAKREAAIVTDIPGTTRDVIEVRLKLGGFLVWLTDTAGLRETLDPVEAEGIKRARKAAEDADIRLWLYPSLEAYEGKSSHSHKDIHVITKADLHEVGNVSRETFVISAKTGLGVDALSNALVAWMRSEKNRVGAPAITRARHRSAIFDALNCFETALDVVSNGFGAEFAAEDVRRGARALASLTGEVDAESVLGAVFSEFCIGK